MEADAAGNDDMGGGGLRLPRRQMLPLPTRILIVVLVLAINGIEMGQFWWEQLGLALQQLQLEPILL